MTESPDAGQHTTPADVVWICPHCEPEPRSLLTACLHITGEHFDCASCSIEHLVLRHLITGHGEIYLSWEPS